jgi:hypothetical protein
MNAPHQLVPHIVWVSLKPAARLVLLANRDVELDDDGQPVVRSETLATTLRDVEEALGLA